MKARKVKGLDPAGSVQDNVRRIVKTRVAELYSFDPRGDARTLHDMRIAAKRLRYVLELIAPMAGRSASKSAREAREIQSLLGQVHDCDVMLDLLERHTARLRNLDAATALSHAPEDGAKLPTDAVWSLPNEAHYRGLETVTVYFRAQRELAHQRFLEHWEKLKRTGFRDRLLDGHRMATRG